MTQQAAGGALDGWPSSKLPTALAASFCAKVLGDLGADVVKVEPPSGHPARSGARAGPTPRPTSPAAGSCT